MTVFLGIVAVLLWLGCCASLFFMAIEAWDRWGWRKGSPIAACAIVVFAAPFGLVAEFGQNDPAENRLCLDGHQEWRTTQRPAIFTGKVLIPGGASTTKVWVCDRWDAS